MMKKGALPVWFLSLILTCLVPFFCQAQMKYALALHGGAGVMEREKMTPERQRQYLENLEAALLKGDSVLRNGGKAEEAVISVVTYLEDCPLFNAGKGAVYSWEGKNELDASIMDGTSLTAGAVASVTTIKNPIKAAQAVKNHSPHVLLSGKGAEKFARKQGLARVSNRYFHTPERYDALKSLRKKERKRTQNDDYGTVGCVALDSGGNLCAGTSTGGMTGKRYGRIGDTPLIGAGTYASGSSCAVSCTGHGEFFIRLQVAREVAARMELKNIALEQAAGEVLTALTKLGGTGGFIAVDRNGNVSMPFNTSGMFRAYIKSTGEKEIAIFAP